MFVKWNARVAAFLLLIMSSMAGATEQDKAGKVAQIDGSPPTIVQHNGAIEYAFSPGESAEKLVLKVIGSAQSEIRVMAYWMTSASIVKALIAARHRGVDVAVVSDHETNVAQDKSGKAKVALSSLANAGCRVRTVSAYPVHHDKVIIVDRETVETGSFNFMKNAATKNSENVLVVWKNAELAKGYLKHWNNRFSSGKDYEVEH
jgi:phosphatidylserine/phosphatidylglycerophosphate/cardiolipin synthase-like enzyme